MQYHLISFSKLRASSSRYSLISTYVPLLNRESKRVELKYVGKRYFSLSKGLHQDQNPSNRNQSSLDQLKRIFDQKDEGGSATNLEAEIKSVEKLLQRSIVEDTERASDQDPLFLGDASSEFSDLINRFNLDVNPLEAPHTKIEREAYLARGLHDLPALSPEDQTRVAHNWMSWITQEIQEEEELWKLKHQWDPQEEPELEVSFFPPNRIPHPDEGTPQHEKTVEKETEEELPLDEHPGELEQAPFKRKCDWCAKEKEHRKELKQKLKIGPAYFDPMNVPFLLQYLSVNGRILPRHLSGNCKHHHKAIARVIKKAEHMGFFKHKHSVFKIVSPFVFRLPDPDDEEEIEKMDDYAEHSELGKPFEAPLNLSRKKQQKREHDEAEIESNITGWIHKERMRRRPRFTGEEEEMTPDRINTKPEWEYDYYRPTRFPYEWNQDDS